MVGVRADVLLVFVLVVVLLGVVGVRVVGCS